MIVHISSGDGKEWKEVVTIDPGEFGNDNGTEPLVRREIGVSVTPGGVFRFDRMVDGLRNSALGGMWDPAYFNYGIAMHGAINVPAPPGVARLHPHVADGRADVPPVHRRRRPGLRVGRRQGARGTTRRTPTPPTHVAQLPIFNRIDPTYTTTTTSTTAPPTSAAPTAAQPPGADIRRRPTSPRRTAADDGHRHPLRRSRRRRPRRRRSPATAADDDLVSSSGRQRRHRSEKRRLGGQLAGGPATTSTSRSRTRSSSAVRSLAANTSRPMSPPSAAVP